MSAPYRVSVSIRRRLRGAGGFVLGFVAGILTVLLSTYPGQDLFSRGSIDTRREVTARNPLPDDKWAPASRMSYELSRAPGVAPSARSKSAALASPGITPATPSGESASAQGASEELAPKVINARPISATPPDPRDTTREIEKEARALRYRGAPEPVAGHATPTHARIVEGRELLLPPRGSESGAGIESRISATREWLSSAPPGTHTIQIMGTRNDEQLRVDLQTLERLLDPGKIYVFRTVAQGKPSTTVVYGAYADRAAAVQALSKLPPAVASNHPVLRTVKGIRAEIAARMPQPES